MQFIQAKTILVKVKKAPDAWFGLTYNMNLYRGCQHQCIYCDSRSECYRIDDFADIHIKENAISILQKEIKSKRLKGTIGTGSMNDPYMPIEKEQQTMRQALEIIANHKFPVHILTKSNLVVRDIDLLKEISKTYAAISFTITTSEDKLSKIIEPGAPSSSERFAAMKALSDAGIYTGMLLMPILPFINDTAENIIALVEMAAANGAKYIIAGMGVTLRDRQREYYYNKLEEHFPGIKQQYIAQFGENYSCYNDVANTLDKLFKKMCKQKGIATKIDIYQAPSIEQLRLF